ncbi:hypothetical protein H1S01_04350 [Heliobacterium chlorum]|uniref:Uncharacterized protein n=1 Tax=Heliobacterium chlorum TaxID=2698 RepID=A0ABR7T175_HELCL|nr:hypothetical protein [Heliobacterium chlorum]MBC9783743.1 hypothetical protein [Heliobacterium chlorum]
MDQQRIQEAISSMTEKMAQVKHAENKAEFIQGAISEMLESMGLPVQIPSAFPSVASDSSEGVQSSEQVQTYSPAIGAPLPQTSRKRRKERHDHHHEVESTSSLGNNTSPSSAGSQIGEAIQQSVMEMLKGFNVKPATTSNNTPVDVTPSPVFQVPYQFTGISRQGNSRKRKRRR